VKSLKTTFEDGGGASVISTSDVRTAATLVVLKIGSLDEDW
jgi:hypothetical protein